MIIPQILILLCSHLDKNHHQKNPHADTSESTCMIYSTRTMYPQQCSHADPGILADGRESVVVGSPGPVIERHICDPRTVSLAPHHARESFQAPECHRVVLIAGRVRVGLRDTQREESRASTGEVIRSIRQNSQNRSRAIEIRWRLSQEPARKRCPFDVKRGNYWTDDR